MKPFVTMLLLATSLSASAQPLYYCVSPPMVCSSLTLLTSWQYRIDRHLIVNGHDYGDRFVYANYARDAVPNSTILPDEIFSNAF